MSTNKTYRIAAASTDGKVINEHFGRADSFIITDINGDSSYSYVENRKVIPLCNSGEHTEEGLLSSIDALSDCTAVVVAKIGVPAKRALEMNGISVFEQPDYIDNALMKLSKYYTKNMELKL